jgi:hypothetical protein
VDELTELILTNSENDDDEETNKDESCIGKAYTLSN